MDLFVIGPRRGRPQAIHLTENPPAGEQAWAGMVKVHALIVLPAGWDQLALWIATRDLPLATKFSGRAWFDVTPARAVMAVIRAEKLVRRAQKRFATEDPDYPALMRDLREQVFCTTQSVMGALAGVSESTISRWESGSQEPSAVALHRIRAHALNMGLPWDDSWVHNQPVNVPIDIPKP